MGQKISDGKAFDAAAPAATVINDGDLFRIGGWNGAAIGAKDAVQVDRTMAFDMDTNAIHSVKFPAGLSPVVGQAVYWTTFDNTTFQRGDTHLAAAVVGAAVFKCLSTKNAAGYVQGRILNIG